MMIYLNHGNKTRICFKDLRKNIMDELKLAYLAGVKVGIESLVEGLKITAEKNGNQLPIEFVKLVALYRQPGCREEVLRQQRPV